MGKLYQSLTLELQDWLAQQKVFFVATSPLAHDSHLNCSPKGADTFRVLNEREVAYVDLTGSGIVHGNWQNIGQLRIAKASTVCRDTENKPDKIPWTNVTHAGS